MKAGDRVRIIGVPSDTRDDAELQTRALFEECVGKVFVIAAVEHVKGLSCELLRIDVGHIVGKAPYMETIWVEPQYVETVAYE
jgi:hypothetical protein